MHHTSHASHAQIFLAHGSSAQAAFSLCVVSQKHSSSRAHDMFRTLLDPPLSSTLSPPTSSSLLFPQKRTNSCAANWTLVWQFCRESPVTGYAHNAPVEVKSTEVTPTLFTFKERKHWIDLLRRRHRFYTCCIGGA